MDHDKDKHHPPHPDFPHQEQHVQQPQVIIEHDRPQVIVEHDRPQVIVEHDHPPGVGGILGGIAAGLAHAAHEAHEEHEREEWRERHMEREMEQAAEIQRQNDLASETLAITQAQAAQNAALAQAAAAQAPYQGMGAIQLISLLLNQRAAAMSFEDSTLLSQQLMALRASLQNVKQQISPLYGQLNGPLAELLPYIDKMI